MVAGFLSMKNTKNTKDFWKNIAYAFLIFLLLASLFSLFNPLQKVEKIGFNQLVEQMKKDEVKKINVKGDTVYIELKDGVKETTQKQAGVSLEETLILYGLKEEELSKANIIAEQPESDVPWLFLFSILPIIIIGFFFWWVLKQGERGAMQAFSFGKAKPKIYGAGGKVKEKVTFNDVAGLEEAKEELKEVVEFLKTPKKFLDMGARIPRGVLLVGAPGTGKTLLARAVASEANVPFFSISGSEFVELFVGIGSSRVRDLFGTAKQSAQKIGAALIFIDELDAIGRQRGAGIGGGHDEREQTLNQILVEMDGFERETNVIIIGASVTGDTPVLVKDSSGEIKLSEISKVIDPYYQKDEEGVEKETPFLEVLGFNKRPTKYNYKNNIYFGNSAFKKVGSVFRHRVSEIFEIEFLGGKIRATGNHSVFIRTQQGIQVKPVSEIKEGEVLVDLPYKVNQKEKRANEFNNDFDLELPLWQPLFEGFEVINSSYQYAIAQAGKDSQSHLGEELGFSQKTIGKWQQGICGPRQLSRNYYHHQYLLPETIKVTPALMKLFGYYTAEGYSRKELDFCFNIKEKDVISDLRRLMKEIFRLEPDRERYITNNAVNIIYYSKPLAKFFAYHCGKGAKNKHLPSFLFETPRDYFIEFLKGYFVGDGYQDKKGKMEITSVSRQIILELNWLCRMHGIKSYICSCTAKAGRRINNGKPLKETKSWRIGLGSSQNPFNNFRKHRTSIKKPIIKKIRKLSYEDYVYDFCGCENEGFFGGEVPILLHNTNRPDILDSALLRPGRFDRLVVLDEPDIKGREAILKIHAKGKRISKFINLREIGERTPGFSGADLANLMNEAAILATRRNKKEITQEELRESIEKVMLGPERKSHILSKKEKKIAAYHEAGHALVASLVPESEPVHKISIISRGLAAGYTLKLPKEEKYLKTKNQFLGELATLLGGYCSEALIFGQITTGASDDLRKATALAKKLVMEYGMSKLGPMTFGEKESLIFLGREITERRDFSEEVAQKIDKEVARFIKEAEKGARNLLENKKNLLDKIAKRLIEKETIERKEFEELIKEEAPKITPKS